MGFAFGLTHSTHRSPDEAKRHPGRPLDAARPLPAYRFAHAGYRAATTRCRAVGWVERQRNPSRRARRVSAMGFAFGSTHPTRRSPDERSDIRDGLWMLQGLSPHIASLMRATGLRRHGAGP